MDMNIKQERQFDMRAPPRRRNSKEKDVNSADNQPIFLRKAYAMISNCPSDIGLHAYLAHQTVRFHSFIIGGWSDAGDTVIVKDVKRFEEQIIPTVYKHNNFSSFVRKLNFCKFIFFILC